MVAQIVSLTKATGSTAPRKKCRGKIDNREQKLKKRVVGRGRRQQEQYEMHTAKQTNPLC